MSIKVTPLSDDLPFGARINGVTMANVRDAEIRKQIDFWQAKVNQLSAAATGRGRISYGVVR